MTYYLISSRNLYNQINSAIGTQSGVYKLCCLNGPCNPGYIPISRLLAIDHEGILYIGSSRCLRDRVMGLRIALSAAVRQQGFTNVRAHPCGHKYSNSRIQDIFAYDRLCVTLHVYATQASVPGTSSCEESDANEGGINDIEEIPITNGDVHVLEEIKELGKYERIFGEAPPFNEGRPKAKRAAS